jgi:hypothetical protein
MAKGKDKPVKKYVRGLKAPLRMKMPKSSLKGTINIHINKNNLYFPNSSGVNILKNRRPIDIKYP